MLATTPPLSAPATNINDLIESRFHIKLTGLGSSSEANFRLRHKIYCQELAYEPASGANSDQEYDCYDKHALHVTIIDKSCNEAVACVRLVLASEQHRLPLEDHCHESLYWPQVEVLQQRSKVAELSRLVVVPEFRTELASLTGDRLAFLPAQMAYLSGIALAELMGKVTVFAMMEPLLPRLLRRTGIHTQRVGDPIEYHGLRCAYSLQPQGLANLLRADTGRIYDKLKEVLAHQLTGVVSEVTFAA